MCDKRLGSLGGRGDCDEEAEFIRAEYFPSDAVYPKYDKKMCYYQEFWKVYLFNEIMISKIKDYSVTNKDLTGQVDELEVGVCECLECVEEVVGDMGAEVQEEGQEDFRYDREEL